jgi:hypothetical protein
LSLRTENPLEYTSWLGMKLRCYKPNRYLNYKRKGIIICEEWLIKPEIGFANFLKDMGPCPSGMTLERKDNSKGYNKDNWKWATLSEQQRNRDNNNNITHSGKTQCITSWANEKGIKVRTIRERFRLGWSIRDALEIPVRFRGKAF